MADTILNNNGLGNDESVNQPLSLETNTAPLQFPIFKKEEIGNWLLIKRKKYNKADFSAEGNLTNAPNSRTITLPLPTNGLQENYTSEWENSDMGLWASYYRENLAGAVNTAANAVDSVNRMGLLSGAINTYQESMPDINLKGIINGAGNIATIYATEMALKGDTFRNTGAFTGMARNPYKSALYTSPMFRSFNFSWKLVAKNIEEARAIRGIIREFKVGMSPSFDSRFSNNIYEYPDIFEIKLTKDEYLVKFKPCVLPDFRAEYASEGSSFIGGPNGEKIPSVVLIDVQFREVQILTRQDFEEGGF